MACYHPLKAYQLGLKDNGKQDLKICSYNVDHLEFYPGKGWEARYDDFVSPYAHRVLRDFIEIPCGQCIGCRLSYSRQWAARMMHEAAYHEDNWFLTLTYNEDNLPRVTGCDPLTGEVLDGVGTLVKRDVQLFMKRLRKNLGQKVRFYCAGEYGTTSGRPHYHIVVFGLHLCPEQLSVYRVADGFAYYNHPDLDRCWLNDSGESKGYIVACAVTYETCAYVARYVTKKLNGDAKVWYDALNIIPEFSLMSLKPGIGRQWYEDHPGVYDEDYIYLSTSKGGVKLRPPRYYDQLYDLEAPEDFAKIKEKRRNIADQVKKAKLLNTTKSYLELLAVEEEALIARTKSLVRSDV